MLLRMFKFARSQTARHISLCVLLLVGLPAASFACSCVAHQQTCDYLGADAVFVGTVTAIVPTSRTINGQEWPGHSMTFAVKEVLKGKIGRQVEVRTNQGGGDCGTPLKPGERYLIFAGKGSEGKLWTGLCSGNQPLPDDGDMENIVGPVRKAVTVGKGSLYGIVTYEAPGTWDAQGRRVGGGTRGIPHMLLRATSQKKTYTTFTAADGKYEFKDLP